MRAISLLLLLVVFCAALGTNLSLARGAHAPVTVLRTICSIRGTGQCWTEDHLYVVDAHRPVPMAAAMQGNLHAPIPSSKSPNSPPTVIVVVHPSEARQGGMVTVTISASDPDGDSLVVVGHVYDPAGIIRDTWTGTGSHTYAISCGVETGTWSADASADDQRGGLDTDGTPFSVVENQGVEVRVSTSQATVPVGGSVAIDACYRDPDADVSGFSVTIKNPSGSVVASWSEDPNVGGDLWVCQAHIYSVPTDAETGTYTTAVRGSDGCHSDTDSDTFKVYEPNEPPRISVSVSPSRLDRPGSTLISTSASDPDGDPLEVSTAIRDPGNNLVAAYDGTGTFAYDAERCDAPGIYTVTSTANDGRASARVSTSFTVNNPPPEVSVSASPAQVRPNDEVMIDVSASDECSIASVTAEITDPDGNTVWTRSGPGTFVHEIGSNPEPGVWTIRATALDGDGATGLDTEAFEVLENSPPEISVFVSPADLDRPGNVTIAVNASDPDGDALEIFAEVRNPIGQVVETHSGAWVFDYSVEACAMLGTYTVNSTVGDGKVTAQDGSSFLVSNPPPTVSVSVDPPSAIRGIGAIEIAIWANDECSLASITTEVGDSSDTLVQNYSGSGPFTFSPACDDPVGTWTARTTVMDEGGANASVSHSFEVGANSAPLASVSVEPTDAHRSEFVSLLVSAEDPDEDLTFVITEIRGPSGLVVASYDGTGSFTFDVGMDAEFGAYEVTTTAVDSCGNSGSNSESFVTSSRSPTATISADPTEAYVGDPVRISATADDPDGDLEDLKVAVSGPGGYSDTLYNGSSPSWSGDWAAPSEGGYTATAEVVDSRGNVHSASVALLLQPSKPEPTPSPTPPPPTPAPTVSGKISSIEIRPKMEVGVWYPVTIGVSNTGVTDVKFEVLVQAKEFSLDPEGSWLTLPGGSSGSVSMRMRPNNAGTHVIEFYLKYGIKTLDSEARAVVVVRPTLVPSITESPGAIPPPISEGDRGPSVSMYLEPNPATPNSTVVAHIRVSSNSEIVYVNIYEIWCECSTNATKQGEEWISRFRAPPKPGSYTAKATALDVDGLAGSAEAILLVELEKLRPGSNQTGPPIDVKEIGGAATAASSLVVLLLAMGRRIWRVEEA